MGRTSVEVMRPPEPSLLLLLLLVLLLLLLLLLFVCLAVWAGPVAGAIFVVSSWSRTAEKVFAMARLGWLAGRRGGLCAPYLLPGSGSEAAHGVAVPGAHHSAVGPWASLWPRVS